MKMLGNGAVGSRRRYLAEQEVFMTELFAKADGLTPITKPVASFKAPAMGGGAAKPAAPKAGGLKPTGKIASSSERLAALKQNMADKIGQTAPSTGAPAAVGTVGKSLRRKGKFQRLKPSTVVKGMPRLPWDGPKHVLFRGKRMRVLEYHGNGKMTVLGPNDERIITHRDQVTFVKPKKKKGPEQMGLFDKREPLKTSVSEDDARKLVDRHGLKGPLPKGMDRNQKMAAYEARYVTAGGKKAEKWDKRARTADKVKTAGLGVATAGGTAWLATRGKTPKDTAINRMMNVKRIRHHAETVAGAGAVAGGAGELYAGHARKKRSSYSSAPGGVAASALRRMRDYTKD